MVSVDSVCFSNYAFFLFQFNAQSGSFERDTSSSGRPNSRGSPVRIPELPALPAQHNSGNSCQPETGYQRPTRR